MARQIKKVPSAAPVPTRNVPHLGLVCITLDERYRFRAVTRARLLPMTEGERERVLTELYWDNVQRLHAILGYLDRNAIRLYRISSAIFPLSDLPEGERALASMRNQMSGVGRRAERLGIRMVIHPDQFVVMNSPSENVRATSRLILEKHGRNLDWLGLPRSPWAAMNIHGGYAGLGLKTRGAVNELKGKGKRSEPVAEPLTKEDEEKARAIRKRELMDLLCREVEGLPAEVRSRLTFENDEHAYSAAEILEVCKRVGVPMVFDNLHHAVHQDLADYDDPSFGEQVRAARATWPTADWQMAHLSNGAAGPTDRYHAGFITRLPASYRELKWVEVEARGKERAIYHLRETWNLSERERTKRVPADAITDGDGD